MNDLLSEKPGNGSVRVKDSRCFVGAVLCGNCFISLSWGGMLWLAPSEHLDMIFANALENLKLEILKLAIFKLFPPVLQGGAAKKSGSVWKTLVETLAEDRGSD